MKHLSRLAVYPIVLLFLGPTVGAPALADDSGPELSVAAARARLTDAHRTLLLGVVSVDRAQKEVAAGALERAVVRRYQQRYWQQLAVVVALEKELSSIGASRDQSQRVDHSARVSRAHLRALRLQSEFEGRNAPAGVGVECLGSISGNVQGPGGPVVGGLVQAVVASGDVVASGLTDSNGDYQIDLLPIGDYYVVTSNSSGLIDEVYDNVVCAGGSCDPTTGSVVTVNTDSVTSGVDFTLGAGGGITGVLTALPGPVPLLFSTVNIFDATGELITSAQSDVTGVYMTLTGLPDGSYRAVTADLLFGNLDELYDNIPCPAGVGCDPVAGSPIAVTAPSMTTGINFELNAGGKIAGTITDSDTTLPIEGILVGVYDSSGTLITFGSSDAAGSYLTLAGLSTGDFFAVTTNFGGYVDELFDNIPCTGGFCTVTGGTPIAVTQGSTTSGIDSALRPGGTFSGTITSAITGEPIFEAVVIGYTATGGLVGTASTDAMGQYTLAMGLGTGSYRATTINPYGYDDELYDDMPCPFGICDVSVGTPIAVTIGLDTPGIDFDLAGESIVSCDFEECSTCGLGVLP